MTPNMAAMSFVNVTAIFKQGHAFDCTKSKGEIVIMTTHKENCRKFSARQNV